MTPRPTTTTAIRISALTTANKPRPTGITATIPTGTTRSRRLDASWTRSDPRSGPRPRRWPPGEVAPTWIRVSRSSPKNRVKSAPSPVSLLGAPSHTSVIRRPMRVNAATGSQWRLDAAPSGPARTAQRISPRPTGLVPGACFSSASRRCFAEAFTSRN
jgi:hypothetical protein